MKLSKIFGFFLPEDRKFFPLFSDAADNLVLTSELFVRLVREREVSIRLEYIEQIKLAEHEGDNFTRRLLNHLDGNLITPFDREDIHRLINKIDDVVDYLYSSATKISFYKLQDLPEEFIWIADCIYAATVEIRTVLGSVRSANDFKNHLHNVEKIHEFEGKVDDIYREYLSLLFEQEVQAIDLIKKRDILSSMEKAIDKCDDIGNIFTTVIIKLG